MVYVCYFHIDYYWFNKDFVAICKESIEISPLRCTAVEMENMNVFLPCRPCGDISKQYI